MSNESKGLLDTQYLALVHRAVLQKIAASKASGEISAERARELTEWWNGFKDLIERPAAATPERIREFKETCNEILAGAGFTKALKKEAPQPVPCSICDGTGKRKCYKCSGAGGFSAGTPPLGYVGPWTSWFTCDVCYGRGGDPCSNCDGTGRVKPPPKREPPKVLRPKSAASLSQGLMSSLEAMKQATKLKPPGKTASEGEGAKRRPDWWVAPSSLASGKPQSPKETKPNPFKLPRPLFSFVDPEGPASIRLEEELKQTDACGLSALAYGLAIGELYPDPAVRSRAIGSYYATPGVMIFPRRAFEKVRESFGGEGQNTESVARAVKSGRERALAFRPR